jgi:glutaredoxin 3
MIGNVEVYTKPDCPYCSRAKQLLRNQGVSYTEYKLDEHFTREIILEKYPNAKSYPIIVLDGFNIGGYTQLIEKINQLNEDTRQTLNEAITL